GRLPIPAADHHHCEHICIRRIRCDSFRPAALGQSASHRPHIKRGLRVVFGHCHDSGDPPHAVGLLCPRSERPRRCAAEQRNELAPFHCPTPPVLPTERIAHLGTAGGYLPPGV